MTARRALLVMAVVWTGVAVGRAASGDTVDAVFAGCAGLWCLSVVPPRVVVRRDLTSRPRQAWSAGPRSIR